MGKDSIETERDRERESVRGTMLVCVEGDVKNESM